MTGTGGAAAAAAVKLDIWWTASLSECALSNPRSLLPPSLRRISFQAVLRSEEDWKRWEVAVMMVFVDCLLMNNDRAVLFLLVILDKTVSVRQDSLCVTTIS